MAAHTHTHTHTPRGCSWEWRSRWISTWDGGRGAGFRIYLKEHASVGTTTTNDSERGCSTGPSYGLFVLRPSWGASATRRARTGPDSCSSLHHPAWHGLVTGKVEFDWLNERTPDPYPLRKLLSCETAWPRGGSKPTNLTWGLVQTAGEVCGCL